MTWEKEKAMHLTKKHFDFALFPTDDALLSALEHFIIMWDNVQFTAANKNQPCDLIMNVLGLNKLTHLMRELRLFEDFSLTLTITHY